MLIKRILENSRTITRLNISLKEVESNLNEL